MKKLFTQTILLCLFVGLFAQEEKKHKVTFSGFVRNDFMYDNRKTAEAIEGLFSLYPLKESLDANGKDINDRDKVNMLGLASRVRAGYTGAEFLGAKFSAVLEADFTAKDEANHLRLRHAFTKLTWERTSLLFGRTWHPLFITSCFPTVMSLNTGVPFQSFNRSNQLTVTHKLGTSFTVLGAAIYQSDYESIGPDPMSPSKTIRSSQFIRNAIVPNLHAQAFYKKSGIIVGAAFDYKMIQPMEYTMQLNATNAGGAKKYTTDETMSSMSYAVFAGYKKNKFQVKAKYMSGQNLYEHLLPGGYAAKSVDMSTGSREYTPINHDYFQLNLLYGKKTQVGLFAGYAKNKGTSDKLTTTSKDFLYARGKDIDNIKRISGFIAHTKNQLMLSAEVEHTIAAYGTPDMADYAKVKDTKDFSSTRLLLSVTYYFGK